MPSSYLAEPSSPNHPRLPSSSRASMPVDALSLLSSCPTAPGPCTRFPTPTRSRRQAPVESLDTASMLDRPEAISMAKMLDELVTPVGLPLGLNDMEKQMCAHAAHTPRTRGTRAMRMPYAVYTPCACRAHAAHRWLAIYAATRELVALGECASAEEATGQVTAAWGKSKGRAATACDDTAEGGRAEAGPRQGRGVPCGRVLLKPYFSRLVWVRRAWPLLRTLPTTVRARASLE